MASVWRMMVFMVLLAGCVCDDWPANLRLDLAQVPTVPSVEWCPWCRKTKTTTTHATTHQTNHTTTPATTAQTNHTTIPSTTAHTNHTTMVSTTGHANHTTAPQPTSPPSPSEYIVNGSSGVCLRIKANFVITLNRTKITNVTIPNGPETKASGNCSEDAAELTLSFPNGKLTLTFRQNKKEKKYSLGAVNITVLEKAPVVFSNSSLEDMSTPMGRSFACKEVVVKLSPAVTFVLSDVHVQAFDVPHGNYGKEYNCNKSSTDNTVPIVVGIVLLVLIVIVVLVYVIARQRKHREGYQTL